ncbi:MAG TPA: hypothetical protein VFP46_01740 [Candidatus Paceibacterota bacterium]|nr:hypothetical protein [Candidatus Paceibacterota bacterium]
MDAELKAKLDSIEALAERAYRSAESSRKILMWTGIITAVLFILPLIALMFVIPSFLSTYTSALSGTGI